LKDSSITHKNFYDIFIKSVSLIPEIENFKLIGDITVETDEVDVSFEIHCRYYNTEKEGELEILFNDVTRTKTKEKQNAEFKYKSLFLSKVAHEFKNPLICIGELIEQSHDQVPFDSNLKKTLDQIKSLSNFLLVLVKDLNYFSEYQMGRNSSSNEKETDLFELIDFCKNITNSLLMKSGKNNSINFIINVDEMIPRIIFTDEWRLKQVLINLLSNSVKFTMIGQIFLQISFNSNEFADKAVVFSVRDTGLGMNEEFSKNLFKPFNKGNFKSNEMGSGLGLVIVNEIASKIGSGVKFHSLPNQGSHFWFSIPLKKANSISLYERIEFINTSIEKSKETRVLSEYVLNKIVTDSVENIYYNKNPYQLYNSLDFGEKINDSIISNNKSFRTIKEKTVKY
jgi:signal transduction histidine kinase